MSKKESDLRRSTGKAGKECETEPGNREALNGGGDWGKKLCLRGRERLRKRAVRCNRNQLNKQNGKKILGH